MSRAKPRPAPSILYHTHIIRRASRRHRSITSYHDNATRWPHATTRPSPDSKRRAARLSTGTDYHGSW
eukprot:scaffold2498_cov114-Isochrysis_galbana.AAC.5